MKKISTVLIMLACLVTNILSPLHILAGTVTSEYEYSLKMPDNWSGYITAEKESFGYNSARVLEKVNFYYKPQYSGNKKLYLMSIYVFFKSDWDSVVQKSSYEYLKGSNKYVFAYTRTKTNPYTNKQDKERFERFIIYVSDVNLVREMIRMEERVANTVTVNGKKLAGKSIVGSGQNTYIPLRETCEALGYNVKWNGASRSVYVSKGGYGITLYLDEKKSPYRITMTNGSVYATVHYFISSIKANTEVDKNNNVFINK